MKLYREMSKQSVFLALGLALLLLFTSVQTGRASSVTVQDQASVLNVARVQTEAARLGRPLFIYTVPAYVDSMVEVFGVSRAFDMNVQGHLEDLGTEREKGIVIGIDVKDRYVSIKSGDQVLFSDEDARKAIKTFAAAMHQDDYNAALIATLHFLQQTLAANESDNIWGIVGKVIIGLAVLGGIIASIRLGFFKQRPDPYRHRYYHSSDNSSGGSSSSGGGSSTGGGAGGFF
ncbi:hypothetical protein EPA93_35300 [Ktedonosporobacter rubrisoli]|uniref:TPM domain-containing protein n=1 Tax=Ktedonosporobacter rubrisoli TaxID=2509675 RepID=A0A4P6JZ10_KTERU|nr:hypothetical protein [Ktedonosporobacter rubrisoli]QBD80954.1 hypothetical protein EPA93_35300 [Ktedonosporobacter rubrisoli]